MGFKLNYPLVGPGGGSNSGRQSIGLPYNRQVGIDVASALLADISASGITALSLERFDPPTDSNAPYPGPGGDFGLVSGEAYLVRTNSSGDYIIVGSHDPGLSISLVAPSVGISNSGRQRYAHPYHGVSANASALLAETGGLSLERFDPATDSHAPYPGPGGDYALVPGEGYLLRVISNTSFVPAHY
jgi:hypothetical protein